MDQSIWAAKGKCNYRLIAGRQLKAEIGSITISIYLVRMDGDIVLFRSAT